MSLSLDAFKEASKPVRAPCSVTVLLRSLDAKDRAALEEALADASVSHTAIAKVLTAEGHRTTGQTVGRHRTGGCLCGVNK
jgi:hypothetical protein